MSLSTQMTVSPSSISRQAIVTIDQGNIKPNLLAKEELLTYQGANVDWSAYREVGKTSVRFNVSETLQSQIKEYADLYDVSESFLIRETLFINTHGRYRFDQMKAAKDGLFHSICRKSFEMKFESVAFSGFAVLPATDYTLSKLDKNTVEYRVRMPEQMKKELSLLARNFCLTLSEYNRCVLTAAFMGYLHFK